MSRSFVRTTGWRIWASVLAAGGAVAASGGEERQIRHEVVVEAPRSEVWKAWTTEEGLTSFFAPAAHVELRADGPFEVYFLTDAPYGQRGSEGCKVLSFVENEMLSFSWGAPPRFPDMRWRRTYVVLQFSDTDDGGTRLRVTNGGYGTGEQWDQVYAYFDAAWPRVLEALQARFADGPRFTEAQRADLDPPQFEHYVYFLRPVRAELLSDGGTPAEQKAIGEHVTYIRDLMASNRVLLGGPCTDPALYPTGTDAVPFRMEAPGIVVYRALNADEAREIMENDPAVKAGVFKGCANPIKVAFREQ